MYHIDKNTNRESVKAIVNSVVVPEFVPKSGVKIAEKDSQLDVNGSGNVDTDQLEVLRKELTDLRLQLSGLVVSPLESN
jgi:ubiquitin-activating enzyme E1